MLLDDDDDGDDASRVSVGGTDIAALKDSLNKGIVWAQESKGKQIEDDP